MFCVRDGRHIRAARIHGWRNRILHDGLKLRRVRSESPARLWLRRAMAIVAIELHRAIRPAQIVFQVYRVIQLDRAGVNTAGAQRREFGMSADEARYVQSKMGSSAGGVQVCVTLRAADVRGYGQARVAAMFCMARGAGWRENLIRVMQRRVVAR